MKKKITRHKFGLKLSGHLPPDGCNNYIIQSIKFNSKISMYLYKKAYKNNSIRTTIAAKFGSGKNKTYFNAYISYIYSSK